MKKSMIAAAVITLGIAAYTVPASANDAYFGGTNYLQYGPSSSVPYTPGMEGEFRSFIGDESASGQDIPASRDQLFDSKDNVHEQW